MKRSVYQVQVYFGSDERAKHIDQQIRLQAKASDMSVSEYICWCIKEAGVVEGYTND